MRRVARLADGWLASAYNTSPDDFATARRTLADLLISEGRDGTAFPNTLATMWLHITDDESERTDVLTRLGVLLRRDSEQLESMLPIGAPDHCRTVVAAYQEAGAERILFWPLLDEVSQLERLAHEVLTGL